MSLSDDELAERNAPAYKITTTLFIGSLLAPLPIYYVLGVGDNTAWPAITGFLLSVVLPLAYLERRRRAGGPDYEEFMRYNEVKDGWSRKAQIAIYSAWIVFVAIAIVVVLVMQPDAPTPT